MNISKNGIRVVEKGKSSSKKRIRIPPNLELDMITFYRIENELVHTIVVPKFSHLRKELKLHGWRVLR